MKKTNLKKLRWLWVVWLILLINSAFVVPYLFLDEIESISGAFLYWCIFAVLAVLSTIKITTYWRD